MRWDVLAAGLSLLAGVLSLAAVSYFLGTVHGYQIAIGAWQRHERAHGRSWPPLPRPLPPAPKPPSPPAS